MARTYTLTIEGRSVEVEVWQDGETFNVRMGEATHTVSLGVIDEGRLFSLLIDGASYEVHSHPLRGAYDLLVRNEPFHIEVERGRRRTDARIAEVEAGTLVLRAPMTGIVAEILVAVGQAVTRGTVLATLESMKMKNELRADRAGVVERVDVQPGQQVVRGAAVLQLKT